MVFFYYFHTKRNNLISYYKINTSWRFFSKEGVWRLQTKRRLNNGVLYTIYKCLLITVETCYIGAQEKCLRMKNKFSFETSFSSYILMAYTCARFARSSINIFAQMLGSAANMLETKKKSFFYFLISSNSTWMDFFKLCYL